MAHGVMTEMLPLDRSTLGASIAASLLARREKLSRQWQRDPIANIQVDDLLAPDTAKALFDSFPRPERMLSRRGLGEHRYIGEQLDQYSALVRETVRAFHDPRVVAAVSELTQIRGLVAETRMGVCGVSQMDRGHFLNPHVDSAHDDDQHRNHQVVSLLYYVTPDLRLVDGGHLELWHQGPDGEATTILSKFNRLVIMATHGSAWHSVSPVRSDRHRCCLWTYYHAPSSVQPHHDHHIPVFRGRPEQKLRDLLLRADTFARQSLYRLVVDRARAANQSEIDAPESTQLGSTGELPRRG
jgi:Rps23 Pro-64 3,4-dihydroxylase Tpa1-like proline 4-hydroxylase